MKLLKTFSLYTFVGFLNAGISFLIMPVLTHYLSPADYGVISLVNTYVSILIPITGLSTAGLVAVEFYNAQLTPQQFRSLFSSLRLVPLLAGIPLLCILFLGRSVLPAFLELPTLAYWLLLPLTLTVIYSDNFASFLVVSKRSLLFSATTLSKVIIEIPLTLLLIVYAGLHWDGRIYAWLATVLLFSISSFYFYNRWRLLSGKVNWLYIKQGVSFGLPLVFHEIGKFVINQSDRLFLAKMVSVEEMGIYSVGYQVGMIILIVTSAFTNFFSPFLMERLNRGTESDRYEIVKVSYIFLAGVLILLVVLTLLTPTLFTYFISGRFAAGAKYVFWVGLSYFFWAVYLIFAGYIYFLKKSKILAYLSIVNVVLNLIFNYLFIKWFGAIGAAYATCLSFFVVSFAVAIIVQKLYPMPWGAWRKWIRR